MKKKLPIEDHDISIGKRSSAFFKFDFGDLGATRSSAYGLSNGHGGL